MSWRRITPTTIWFLVYCECVMAYSKCGRCGELRFDDKINLCANCGYRITGIAKSFEWIMILFSFKRHNIRYNELYLPKTQLYIFCIITWISPYFLRTKRGGGILFLLFVDELVDTLGLKLVMVSNQFSYSLTWRPLIYTLNYFLARLRFKKLTGVLFWRQLNEF